MNEIAAGSSGRTDRSSRGYGVESSTRSNSGGQSLRRDITLAATPGKSC